MNEKIKYKMLAILGFKPISAKDLSFELNLDLSMTYKMLKEFQEYGVIEELGKQPKKYKRKDER